MSVCFEERTVYLIAQLLAHMTAVVDYFRTQSATARDTLPPEITAHLKEIDRLAVRRQVALALERDEAETPVSDEGCES